MPDTVSVAHNWSGNNNEYFVTPPLPKARQLQSLLIILDHGTNGATQFWFGLTTISEPDAACMTASPRLIDRGNVSVDGRPSINLSAPANTAVPILIPLHTELKVHGQRIIIGALNGADIVTDVLVIATVLFQSDIDAMFGVGRVIQTPGVQPGPIISPGPALGIGSPSS